MKCRVFRYRDTNAIFKPDCTAFLLMAMVLVAGIFSLKASQRQGGVLLMIVSGIATGFTVYFTSQVVSAFGINSYIPAWFAVWVPAIIVASISISVYLHKEE